MADFEAIVSGGVVVQPWVDQASDDLPSRLNTKPGVLHRRYVVPVGGCATVQAKVDGVLAPLDSALDGRLFQAWFAEQPAPGAVITGTPSRSSEQRFVPLSVGHYTFMLSRAGGGGVLIHIDAQ